MKSIWKVIAGSLGCVWAITAVAATVPADTAISNLASYAKKLGFVHLSGILAPRSSDYWMFGITTAIILIAIAYIGIKYLIRLMRTTDFPIYSVSILGTVEGWVSGLFRTFKEGWQDILGWAFYWMPNFNYEVKRQEAVTDADEFANMATKNEWFDGRFLDAFPGLREPTSFVNPSEIAHRLGVLLRAPLSAVGNDNTSRISRSPIWWSRGLQDNHITSWKRIHPSIFLMNSQELKIVRIHAVPGHVYWQHFVYVECAPQEPIGLRTYSAEDMAGILETFGFYWEEFCIYRFRVYSRAAYDDGGFSKAGRVTQFKHRPDPRMRYLTKFNFLIVSGSSPAHASEYQSELHRRLNDCLRNSDSLDSLSDWLLSLPRNAIAESREHP